MGCDVRLPFPVKQPIFQEAALIFIKKYCFVLEEMEFQGVKMEFFYGLRLPGKTSSSYNCLPNGREKKSNLICSRPCFILGHVSAKRPALRDPQGFPQQWANCAHSYCMQRHIALKLMLSLLHKPSKIGMAFLHRLWKWGVCLPHLYRLMHRHFKSL